LNTGEETEVKIQVFLMPNVTIWRL
jgi:hypothetical protein